MFRFSLTLGLIFSLSSCSLKPSVVEVDLNSSSALPSTTTVAVVNFEIRGGQDLKSHATRIRDFAKKSKSQGAAYLVLPELTVFDLMAVKPAEDQTKDELIKLARLSGEYQNALIKVAKEFDLNIVGASTVIKSGQGFLNRAYFIEPSGKLHYQDKLKPTPWEFEHGFMGVSKVRHFETKDFRFVILICHDAEFPSISVAISEFKPDVIFVPSMTDDVYGLSRVKITSEARSIEHMAYVIMTGVSSLPKAPWHAYEGKNYFFVPQNKYFENPKKSPSARSETLSFFSLDVAQLRKARADKKQIYPIRDAR
jgi:predicted amidohydrolase